MLDEAQLGRYIDSRFTTKLWRLEDRDGYDVDSDGGDLARYLAGEPGPDMARKGPWMDQIRREVARGLHTYRVHVVSGSLSDHTRFEFEWGLRFNAEAGEHDGVLDLTVQPAPPALVREDFWLIDGADDAEAVLLMHYGPGGEFLGAEVAAARAVPRYRAAMQAAWEAAVPFGTWWDAHPQYHRDRRRAA